MKFLKMRFDPNCASACIVSLLFFPTEPGRSTLPTRQVHMCSSLTQRPFLYLHDLCLPFIYNIKILNELLNSGSVKLTN